MIDIETIQIMWNCLHDLEILESKVAIGEQRLLLEAETKLVEVMAKFGLNV